LLYSEEDRHAAEQAGGHGRQTTEESSGHYQEPPAKNSNPLEIKKYWLIGGILPAKVSF